MSLSRKDEELSFSEKVKKAFETPVDKTDYEAIKQQNDCFDAFFKARKVFYNEQKQGKVQDSKNIPMMQHFEICDKAFTKRLS